MPWKLLVSKWRAGTALLLGLGLAAGGFGSGAAYLLLALLASEATFPLSNLTGVAGLAVLGLGLSLLLLWHGLRAWRGEDDLPFRPPRAVVLVLIFVGAAAAGQGVIAFDLAPRILFPPFHVLAGALPPMVLLAFVGHRLGRAVRWREIVTQMACSILIGGTGAIVLVGLAGVAILFLLAFLVALAPGGLEILQSLILNLQDPVWIQDPNNILPLIFTPAGIIGILMVVVVTGPLVEELLKPVGVLFIPRRPGKAAAFLWGLAGASAFALTESLFNTSISLDIWLPVMVMRVGTSFVHCLAGGLVGLGWYALRTARHPWRAAGLYLLAVTLHATWNLVTLGTSALAIGTESGGEMMAGFVVILLLGVLGFILLGCIVALVWLVRWLQADLLDEPHALAEKAAVDNLPARVRG